MEKRLIIITGPIGAGKTTVLPTLQSLFCLDKIEVLSVDLLASSLCENLNCDYSEANRIAKIMMFERLTQAREKGESLIWEAVFAKDDKFRELNEFVKCGYRIIVFYVSVKSVQTCWNRISLREKESHYSVPQNKVIKRYKESNSRFEELLELSDDLWLVENDKEAKQPCDIFDTLRISRRTGKMYKMITVDCDGTLLTSDKRITPESLEAIEKAKQRGISVVIATARPYYRIKKYNQLAGLSGENDYSIVFNGGLIVHNKTNQILYSNSLSTEEVKFLIGLSQQYNKKVFLYTATGILASYLDEKYLEKNKGVNYSVVDFNDIDLEKYKIFKFVFVNSPDKILELKKNLPQELFDRFEATSSVPQFIEVVKEGVTKSEAIQFLCEKLNVERKELIAFGDEENDLSMMKEAGFSVAMANAADEVKEIADFITKTNDENGFSYALNAILPDI